MSSWRIKAMGRFGWILVVAEAYAASHLYVDGETVFAIALSAIALGCLSNYLVIKFNGDSMPAAVVGTLPPGRHHEDEHTKLRWLIDRIEIDIDRWHTTCSIGDCLIIAGNVMLVAIVSWKWITELT